WILEALLCHCHNHKGGQHLYSVIVKTTVTGQRPYSVIVKTTVTGQRPYPVIVKTTVTGQRPYPVIVKATVTGQHLYSVIVKTTMTREVDKSLKRLINSAYFQYSNLYISINDYHFYTHHQNPGI